ncbi:MAG TPA: NMD3-related protein [Thermoplasmata archaeon]|jgi:nonsense-mediated mRNA decay protein 3|nr:NMD3-related protein [Thermoplasmata archaeon]
MAFCVECGREGETFEGVCRDHFQKKHKLVRAPEYLDLTRCAKCGSLNVGGRWIAATLEDVLLDLLRAAAETDPHVQKVQYTYDLRPQDDKNVAVTVKASCTVGPWDLVDSFHTRVRIQTGMCPTDSQRAGKFFVGTVQIRADGRDLAAEEVRRARTLVDGSATGAEFVSRVEDVAGGFDVKVSSNEFAKRLAKDLSRALGGTVGSSATLHTQKEGKDQYRATYVVRLPAFREGDLVLWKRRKYRVVGVGDPVRLEDAATGETARVRLRELSRARVVGK